MYDLNMKTVIGLMSSLKFVKFKKTYKELENFNWSEYEDVFISSKFNIILSHDKIKDKAKKFLQSSYGVLKGMIKTDADTKLLDKNYVSSSTNTKIKRMRGPSI